jgi:hypothetical protein
MKVVDAIAGEPNPEQVGLHVTHWKSLQPLLTCGYYFA